MTQDGNGPKSLEALRAEMAESYRAARDRVVQRTAGTVGTGASRQRARGLLASNRSRVRSLLGNAPETARSAALPAADAHTVDRLLSHVRHSVVRVCFYNLKLLCPSLLDEYDAELGAQVDANLGALGEAQSEFAAFFAVPLSTGETIAQRWPQHERAAAQAVDALLGIAHTARGGLGESAVRERLAEAAPGHIDAAMAALSALQQDLDAAKLALGELAEEAAELSAPTAKEHGLDIALSLSACPRVFAHPTRLRDAFCELIGNAARHAQATRLEIALGPTPDARYVEAAFTDNGKGMDAGLRGTCLHRGVTTGGTGEGLPMVLGVVEEEHLGALSIETAPGAGCTFRLRIPVKFEPAKDKA